MDDEALHARIRYTGGEVHMDIGEVIADFDSLVADRGFNTAKSLVESGTVKVVECTPRGCSRRHAIMLIDLGELENMGSGGWNDTEAAFDPKGGT